MDADSGDVEGRRVAVLDPHVESDSGRIIAAGTDSGDVTVRAARKDR